MSNKHKMLMATLVAALGAASCGAATEALVKIHVTSTRKITVAKFKVTITVQGMSKSVETAPNSPTDIPPEFILGVYLPGNFVGNAVFALEAFDSNNVSLGTGSVTTMFASGKTTDVYLTIGKDISEVPDFGVPPPDFAPPPPDLTMCPNGRIFCNGKCVDLTLDPANCGACGNACGNNQICQNGVCVFNCPTMCNGRCVDTNTDPTNCGACGNICSFANAAPVCMGGVCTLGACNMGYENCNGNNADGCEAQLESDLLNCGGCGKLCRLPNATTICGLGQCGILACNPGFADCDKQVANGCEVPLWLDIQNCGACGVKCSFGANSVPVCGGGGVCSYLCVLDFGDCDRQAQNGCEADLKTDAKNCGGCGVACQPPANASGVCINQACSFACMPGYADCNVNPNDGCEVNPQTDPLNCGACNMKCKNGEACMAGKCVARLANGQPCVVGTDCQSGYCTGLGARVCADQYDVCYRIDNAGNAAQMFCVPKGGGNTIKKPINLGMVEFVANVAYCFAVQQNGLSFATGVVGKYGIDAAVYDVCVNNFNNNASSGLCVTVPGQCGGCPQ